MAVTGSISAPDQPAQRFTPQQRMERLAALDPNQILEAFAALVSFNPEAFDAVLDMTDPPAREEYPDLAPYCRSCGQPLGLFPRWGFAWKHYVGEGESGLEHIRVTDPGHAPVLAWRPDGQ
jgi:hypothetical protein